MNKATVFDIKRFAVHDGDGIRTTVFFKGCPLSCIWCHNPEGISKKAQISYNEQRCTACGKCAKACRTGAHVIGEKHILHRETCTLCGECVSACPADAIRIYGGEMTVDELMPRLLSDRAFFESTGGGVTLSGGECTLYFDFLYELLCRLKDEGISAAVDTCGYTDSEKLKRLIPLTDTFLYDLKAYDVDVHKHLTGVSNDLIIKNLHMLDESGARIEIRIPYVPECNADQIEKLARLISSLKFSHPVRLLKYHSHAEAKYASLGMECTLPRRMPTDEEMESARAVLSSHGIRVLT